MVLRGVMGFGRVCVFLFVMRVFGVMGCRMGMVWRFMGMEVSGVVGGLVVL